MIADETAALPISFWGEFIDQMKENVPYTLTKVNTRSFYGTRLTTTAFTTITACEDNIAVNWDTIDLEAFKPTATSSATTLCCPEIANVKVNMYPLCTNRAIAKSKLLHNQERQLYPA